MLRGFLVSLCPSTANPSDTNKCNKQDLKSFIDCRRTHSVSHLDWQDRNTCYSSVCLGKTNSNGKSANTDSIERVWTQGEELEKNCFYRIHFIFLIVCICLSLAKSSHRQLLIGSPRLPPKTYRCQIQFLLLV